MSLKKSQSPLDKHQKTIEQLLAQGKSQAEILEYLRAGGIPTSDRSLRRALKRWGFRNTGVVAEPASFNVAGDEADIVTPVYEFDRALNNVEDMVRERGLDPEHWEVTNLTVNEWDSPTGETLKQMKLHLKKRREFFSVIPARTEGWTPKPSFANLDGQRLVVLCGDQQAPYHNEHLHDLFCQWLEVNKPQEGILMGDTIDLPVISRHPNDPDWAATTQECVNAAGQILRDYVTASTSTFWQKLPGNHDERLRRAIIDRLADFYGLKPAEVEGMDNLPPIHDPVHLLRLDELGIKFIRHPGSYDHAQIKLSPYLAARHGWIARKNSGSSAHATLDHLGHSVVVGHTHRQSHVHQTKFDIDRKPSTNAAVETGCMCRIEEGLGYAVAPDWQNGFATATIYEDGTFKLDLATYVGKKLYWRDQRYT